MKSGTVLNIMALLKRTQLSGEEVPVYNECIAELNIEYVNAQAIEKTPEKTGE
jgi:hypothetical protein